MGSDSEEARIVSGDVRRKLQDAIVQIACCSPITLENIETELGFELEALTVAGFKWSDNYNAKAALQRLVKLLRETTNKAELTGVT